MPSSNLKSGYNNLADDLVEIKSSSSSNEIAFQNGIPFQCKYIGSLDIARPTSRVEIVAAMRRVRFEFKQKGIKKKKVTLTVSTEGIRTCLRKKNSNKRKKKLGLRKHSYMDVESSFLIEGHPIYRIFYVSHDSQDVKIFSYIARETSSNLFHCVVFKAAKKAQAMKIVRTVGQAFEVCHKLIAPAGEEVEEIQNFAPPEIKEKKNNRAQKLFNKLRSNNSHKLEVNNDVENKTEDKPAVLLKEDIIDKEDVKPVLIDEKREDDKLEEIKQEITEEPIIKEQKPIEEIGTNKKKVKKSIFTLPGSYTITPPPSPLQKKADSSDSFVVQQEMQLLKEKLEQQRQQTQAALGQISLLNSQLIVEQRARVEAQARTHQLLLHNKELLDHLQNLVGHIQELEQGKSSISSLNNNNNFSTAMPQLTGRSKIERWFQLTTMVDDIDEIEEEFNKFGPCRDSKRTLVSKVESGFVSENTLKSGESNYYKRQRNNTSKNFLGPSSIMRRVFSRNKRISNGTKKRVQTNTSRISSL